MKLTIDFETRSLVDLTKTTTHRYAEDPSTQVLCLALKPGDGEPLWWAPDPIATTISDENLQSRRVTNEGLWHNLSTADTIEAHNMGFERAIWKHIMHKRYGFEDLPLSKCRCSAAKAAMHGLPRSLGQAADALKLKIKKDAGGRALMLKMCKPMNPLKAHLTRFAEAEGISISQAEAMVAAVKARDYSGPNDHLLLRWHEDYEGLLRYCLQDVEAEHALSRRLRDLPPSEQFVWELDQRINDRGLPIDMASVNAFLDLIGREETKLNEEFQIVTGGAVGSPKSYVAFAKWVNEQGVKCEGVGAEAVDAMLGAGSLPPHVEEALRIAQKANKSSTAKYAAMERGASSDNRMRDTLMYHGAGTGRWTSRGIQAQNLPRGSFSNVDDCIELVAGGCGELIPVMYGDVLEAASTCIRGMIAAPEGRKLVAADYSAIEGRVLAWLAGEESELEVYRNGQCPYSAAASKAFGVPYQEIFEGNERGDKAMKALRHKGKTSVLACLAADTLVLTKSRSTGEERLKEILDVTHREDYVFDGENWVKNQGWVSQGWRNVGYLGGIQITPDHMVLLDGRWIQAWEHPDFIAGDFLSIPVYDLLNCGPRFRFTVQDKETGKQYVVHNCGYGGGKNAIWKFAPDMPAKEAKEIVRLWRASHPNTKAFWYALTDAASLAVRNPNTPFPVGKVAFMYQPRYGFLQLRLPSGRLLYYAFPETFCETAGPGEEAKKALVTPGAKFKFGDKEIWADNAGFIHVKEDDEEEVYGKDEIGSGPLWRKDAWRTRAWTVDGVTKKWVQRDLSHLILSENAVQATARDILVQGLMNLEEAGYGVVMHVHDEAVSEVDIGFGSVEEFEELMCWMPKWADGLPLKAEGWQGKRFRK